jgi:hypothetical protein
MNGKRFAAIWLMFLMAPAFGQVFKWTDANGRVHYGDAPQTLQGAKIVNTNRNSVPVDADYLAKEKQRLDDAEVERLARTHTSSECAFNYHTIRDPEGKRKAQAARDECMRDRVRKQYGIGRPTGSTAAQDASRQHLVQESARRQQVIQQAQQTQKLNEINNRLADMESRNDPLTGKPKYECKPSIGRDSLICK